MSLSVGTIALGFVGLLLFIPLLGFLVYLYIAFHDGVRPPHKVGLLLGLLLIGGNNFVQVRAFDVLGEQMQAAASGESGEASGPFAAFGSSMRIVEGMAEAEKLDPRDPAELARLTELVAQIHRDIDASEAELDSEICQGRVLPQRNTRGKRQELHRSHEVTAQGHGH